jgi:hypothetical protein
MSSQEKPVTAFALALTGGILILISGLMSPMWFMLGGLSIGGIMDDMMSGFGGMMGGYRSMMGSFGVPFGFMSGLSFVGLVSGILVVIGAIVLNARPSEHTAWEMIILIFSIISLFGMGGFLIGAILGIIGGAFAFSWTPQRGK